MAELKTQKSNASVQEFLNAIEDPKRRADTKVVCQLMREVTGKRATMWGTSIIGFGNYHYRYESGTEGDWFLTGVSPRKQALTLYVMSGFPEYEALMKRLGKYKTGKACLYIKKLDDVELPVLRELIEQSVQAMRSKYPEQ